MSREDLLNKYIEFQKKVFDLCVPETKCEDDSPKAYGLTHISETGSEMEFGIDVVWALTQKQAEKYLDLIRELKELYDKTEFKSVRSIELPMQIQVHTFEYIDDDLRSEIWGNPDGYYESPICYADDVLKKLKESDDCTPYRSDSYGVHLTHDGLRVTIYNHYTDGEFQLVIDKRYLEEISATPTAEEKSSDDDSPRP